MSGLSIDESQTVKEKVYVSNAILMVDGVVVLFGLLVIGF